MTKISTTTCQYYRCENNALTTQTLTRVWTQTGGWNDKRKTEERKKEYTKIGLYRSVRMNISETMTNEYGKTMNNETGRWLTNTNIVPYTTTTTNTTIWTRTHNKKKQRQRQGTENTTIPIEHGCLCELQRQVPINKESWNDRIAFAPYLCEIFFRFKHKRVDHFRSWGKVRAIVCVDLIHVDVDVVNRC